MILVDGRHGGAVVHAVVSLQEGLRVRLRASGFRGWRGYSAGIENTWLDISRYFIRTLLKALEVASN